MPANRLHKPFEFLDDICEGFAGPSDEDDDDDGDGVVCGNRMTTEPVLFSFAVVVVVVADQRRGFR